MSASLSAITLSGVLMILVIAVITVIVGVVTRRAEVGSPQHQPAVPSGIHLGKSISRRSWISWMAVSWVAFVASVTAGVAATGRFMFPNVLFEPPTSFKAGFPKDILPGAVDSRFKQKYGVWLVRDKDPVTGANGIVALSDICTHLGCIPNWLEEEQKFKCPCHGSGYYKNGINFEGPTPRPLERFAIALSDDGQLLVDKNRKFQYEKGEWSNPDSFLKLS